MKLRDKIFAANDVKLHPMTVPEWDNAELFLRPLSGEDRFRLQQVVEQTPEGENNFLVEAFVVLGTCESTGERAFEWDDRIRLAQEKDADVIARVQHKVQEVSGMLPDYEAELSKK